MILWITSENEISKSLDVQADGMHKPQWISDDRGKKWRVWKVGYHRVQGHEFVD